MRRRDGSLGVLAGCVAAAIVVAGVACGDPDPIGSPTGGGGSGGGAGTAGGGGTGGAGATGGTGATGGSGGAGVLCTEGCPPGTVCDDVSGYCVDDVACEPACGAGFRCVAGMCTPEQGAVGDACAANEDCQSGQCVRSRTSESFCSAPCAACGPGTRCVSAGGVEGCALDSFRTCEFEGDCPGDACTYWTFPAGHVAGCSVSGFGQGVFGAPCTTGDDCATGLCSGPGPGGEPSMCTKPCTTAESCEPVSDTCGPQALDFGGTPATVSVCVPRAGGTPGGYGDCCATDADCHAVETYGCQLGADGTTRSCAAAWTCATDDECAAFLGGNLIEGNCLNEVCVSPTCNP